MNYKGITTGCYDIDGTEIYEGDILEHAFGGRSYTLTVRYDPQWRRFMALGGAADEPLYSLDMKEWRVAGSEYGQED